MPNALKEPIARSRDAQRSRRQILDAAERLFAERGYEATTMADIASASGLSRGAPAYFFTSKDELYRSTLARVFEEMAALIRNHEFGVGDPRGVITDVVSSYLDFLAARPNFVRLVTRECLDGGRFLQGLPAHLAALGETLSGIAAEGRRGSLRAGMDSAHLLLSGISLCWFPLVATPLCEDLGLKPATASFLRSRQDQVAKLILHGAFRVSKS